MYEIKVQILPENQKNGLKGKKLNKKFSVLMFHWPSVKLAYIGQTHKEVLKNCEPFPNISILMTKTTEC